MLRVRSLDLENFGPYRGSQTIDFGGKDGVIVVFGENMRGKTTLLNGIRFALFGRILGRGEREIKAHKLLNYQAEREGIREFTVTLRLEKSGTLYDVVRTCRVPEGDDSDPEVETVLFVDGDAQSQDATVAQLADLLPEQVSRFFLFDGELLQQYEELLLGESEAAFGIREAIESILGLPVLVQGREDLGALLVEAWRAEAKAGKQHKATEAVANQLEILNAKLDAAKQSALDIESEIADLKQQREETEDVLRRNGRIQALLTQRDSLEKDIHNLEDLKGSHSLALGDMLATSWQWPLFDTVNAQKVALTNEVRELRDKTIAYERDSHLVELRDNARRSGRCPVCREEVATDAEFEEGDVAIREDREAWRRREDEVHQRLSLMNRLSLDNRGPAAVEMSRQLHQVEMDLRLKEDNLGEVMAQLLASPEKEVEGASQRLGHLITALQQYRTTLSGVRREIDEFEKAIDAAQRKLQVAGGNSLAAETRKREVVEGLRDAFAGAVGRYRDELRAKVEADASVLFRKLTTEPDYDRLIINDNYGLQIQHKDGLTIEVRSSGAEHIVALSLVGALQANAPLHGPLFIDSPYGRLDESHVERVLKSLPDMARQAVLLVYRKEMSEQMARNALRSRLLSEYELKRVSAIHTEIERCTGGGR